MKDKDAMRYAVATYETELEAWKVVKFNFDNIHAVRSCGELVRFTDDYEAKLFVKERAMGKVVAQYTQRVAEATAARFARTPASSF